MLLYFILSHNFEALVNIGLAKFDPFSIANAITNASPYVITTVIVHVIILVTPCLNYLTVQTEVSSGMFEVCFEQLKKGYCHSVH